MYNKIKGIAEKSDTEFKSSYYDSISDSFCISFLAKDIDLRDNDIIELKEILDGSYRISLTNIGNESYCVNIYFYANSGGCMQD